MPRIQIEIPTHEPFKILREIYGETKWKSGEKKLIAEDAYITYNGSFHVRSADSQNVMYFVLTIGTSIATGLIANWLYDILKRTGTKRITINRRTVELHKGQIKRVIEEMIEIEG